MQRCVGAAACSPQAMPPELQGCSDRAGRLHTPLDRKPCMANRSLGALPVQDCNLVVLDSKNNLIFQSATTKLLENPAIQPPCHLVVSGTGGGFVAIIDSFNEGDQTDTVLYTRPLIGNGIMREGQSLPQVPLALPLPMPIPQEQPLLAYKQHLYSAYMSLNPFLTKIVGAWWAQNVRLYSPDGQVFINTQADGNCVL